jgi:hypothetical protein
MVIECNKIKNDCKKKTMSELKEGPVSSGFKDLLNAMMKRRWLITAIVLFTFLLLTVGIVISIHMNTQVGQEWKELLLLMLGAFIGSYGKIIDYWFSDTDKDKMLVQKMDEEDGVSLSNTADMKESQPKEYSPIVPDSFTNAINNLKSEPNNPQHVESPFKPETKVGVEVDEDGDGVMDGLDFDGDGKIDEYFAHRQCEHVWGDSDGDGDLECLKCGKIKDPNPDDHMEG